MRYMKKLAILAIAVAALVAFAGVSSASAAPHFTAGTGGQSIGELEEKRFVLIIQGTITECSNYDFWGYTEPGSQEVYIRQRANIEVQNCIGPGGLEAVVDTKGCKIGVFADTGAELSGCASGGITITVDEWLIACTMFIPNQSIPAAVSYENSYEGLAVGVTAAASGFLVKVPKATGFCPLKQGSEITNTSLTGKSTFYAAGGLSWEKE